MKAKIFPFLITLTLLSGCAIHAKMIVGGSFVKNNFVPDEVIAEYIPQGKTPFGARYFLVSYKGGPAFYEYHGEDENTLMTNVLETESGYQFGIWVPERVGARIYVPRDHSKPLVYTLLPGRGYKIISVSGVRFPEQLEGVETKSYEFNAIEVKNFPANL